MGTMKSNTLVYQIFYSIISRFFFGVNLSDVEQSDDGETGVVVDDDMKTFAKHNARLTVSTAIFLILAWIFGSFGIGFIWLIPFLFLVFTWWNRTSAHVLKTSMRFAEMQAHRERAFQNAETAEWLNFVINRWCVFSESSILSLIKTNLDPYLEEFKPSFIESIEVEDFTVGNRTPYFKYIECFDSFEDNRNIKASEITLRFPPEGLATMPKYKAVMNLDVGLSSPDSKFIIRVRLAKGGFLDLSTSISVEDLHINGKMQIVLSFNRNIPFPHLAAISLCFLEEPKVEFDIRLLKSVQLMEFPLLKNWMASLLNDCLKLSLVDPGRITIPLCDDPDVLGHGSQFACGVLTLTINGGFDGPLTDDTHWCALRLGEQHCQLKEITNGNEWSDKVSVLVYNLSCDELTIKMKAKRKLGNKYTVLEYHLPLARFTLDVVGSHEETLEKSRQRGSKMKIFLEYTSLPVVNITEDTTNENFQENYNKIKEHNIETNEVAGVVCVVVHSAQNLLPMDKNGLSDPYCILYKNKQEVKRTNSVANTLNPVWDNVIEFCTADYTRTVMSLVIHDKDVTALETLRIKDDPDDFMGSCNFCLSKDEPYFFKKKIDVMFRISSMEDGLKKAGIIYISALFRPVATVATTEKLRPMEGLPDGEPLHKKYLKKKKDSQALDALMIAERGGMEIQIIQGRDLVVMDVTGKSDPFVTIKYGTKEKYRTKVIYNTLTPVWNETCRLPLPNKNDKLTIDVWDKDPLSQEKMGHVTFTLAQLKQMRNRLGAKEWYELKKVKSGEIQIGFTYISSQSEQDTSNSIIEEEEESDSTLDTEDEKMNHSENGDDASSSKDVTFHNVSGEVGDVKNLPEQKDMPQVYFKGRLDSHKGWKKNRASFTHKNVLFKTTLLPYSSRQHLGMPFKQRGPINSSMYIILEAKGKGKTQETIDHVAITLGELFAGKKYCSRWLKMENGTTIHITMTCEEIMGISLKI
ncbi:uncharacterized protein PYUK71.03c-like isoform X2 [Xenia sp. Carnegie-2017]|uniref:uncharacterized protein PYUK71.03c-like isoform X2 n=1 Tax=Xenia sp. Carnegie-2017 TaxID=2897299 RepID=UPI001F03611B|nr:uncharacterized protein PYUK71.03c-like isoform X2 [Xenia sp. Carnegie-2017]